MQYHKKQIIETKNGEKFSLGQEAPCITALLIKYAVQLLEEAVFVSDKSGITFKVIRGAV